MQALSLLGRVKQFHKVILHSITQCLLPCAYVQSSSLSSTLCVTFAVHSKRCEVLMYVQTLVTSNS